MRSRSRSLSLFWRALTITSTCLAANSARASSGLAAFSGGITEVMANPIAESIRMRGGVVDRGAAVTSLIVQEGGVCGVRVGSEEIRSAHVILAAHWRRRRSCSMTLLGRRRSRPRQHRHQLPRSYHLRRRPRPCPTDAPRTGIGRFVFLFLSITLVAFSNLNDRNRASGIGLFNAGRQLGWFHGSSPAP